MKKIIEKLIKEALSKEIRTRKELDELKRKYSAEFNIPFLKNSELLNVYYSLVKKKKIGKSQKLESLLQIRKVRTLSGVAVVAILTKPYPCPGKCFYCPSQKGVPKSYLDNEPAVMRAIDSNYHPYYQIRSRIQSLEAIGHPTDKIELIIIGGTWSFLPKQYQTWFIKECYKACNSINSSVPRSQLSKKEKFRFDLIKLQKLNEKAKHRIVGLTLETRPDFINIKEIKRMRKFGCTRVEIGVQTIFDDILKLNKRGHKVKEIIEATRLLKDAGFKVCYHLMPNLPGSNLKKDKEMFKKIFGVSDFRPDLLKIYPCVILKEAPLYLWYKTKKYQPYSLKELIGLLKWVKKRIPYYCRIQRLIRDIPTTSIVAGCRVPNLRQVLYKKMKKEGWRCKCIRCREVRENYNPKDRLKLFRLDYQSSGGQEIFLSFETPERKKLYSLLRLRIPSQVFSNQKHFIKTLNNSALIREVHTYGQLMPINQKGSAPQHQGLGKKLIAEAEKIARQEFGLKKIAVISGVGVRDYYRKLGYRLEDTYMVKKLK